MGTELDLLWGTNFQKLRLELQQKEMKLDCGRDFWLAQGPVPGFRNGLESSVLQEDRFF